MVIRWLSLILIFASCQPSIEHYKLDHKAEIISISHKNTNVYIIANGTDQVMIDAGYAGTEKTLEEAIADSGIDIRKISHLILTHGHGDHAGNAAYLKSKYNIEIIAGYGDAPMFAKGDNGDLCPTTTTGKLLSWFIENEFPKVEIDHYIQSGDTLSLMNDAVRIFNLAGHTPGSIIIQYEDALIVGDLIRGQPLNNERPTRHYYMCDTADNNIDIKTLLQIEGIKTWYPGHFGPLHVADISEWLNRQI